LICAGHKRVACKTSGFLRYSGTNLVQIVLKNR